MLDLDPYGGTDPLGMFPLFLTNTPTKPVTLLWQRGFSVGGATYAKPSTAGRAVSYGKIGLMTVAVTQNLISGMPLVLKI